MSADVIPFTKPKEKERKCSFCGGVAHAGRMLLNSTVSNHSICNHCLHKAKRRIEEHEDAK